MEHEPAHVCKQEDIETAQAILNETKPCPVCAARIFKTQGCDQMWCVQCHTAFSWRTGQIETGVIHNPHYYELQRQLARGGNQQRAAGDVPCGGLIHLYDILYSIIPPALWTHVQTYHQRTAEIGAYINRIQRNPPSFEIIRVKYLIGDIKTKEEFERAIFEMDIRIHKFREEIQILTTFQTAAIERFRNLCEYSREVNTRQPEGSDELLELIWKLKVSDIKQILKKKDLSVDGNKETIVNRLYKHMKENDEDLSSQMKTYAKSQKYTYAPLTKTLPHHEKIKLMDIEVKKFINEFTEIVDFCNKAFKETFELLGCTEYPVIYLTKEYDFENKSHPERAMPRAERIDNRHIVPPMPMPELIAGLQAILGNDEI